jgi:hypothetical protein
MRDDGRAVDLRATRILAVAASIADARRALLRAARMSSPFSSEIRAVLQAVADLDQRVNTEAAK